MLLFYILAIIASEFVSSTLICGNSESIKYNIKSINGKWKQFRQNIEIYIYIIVCILKNKLNKDLNKFVTNGKGLRSGECEQ